MLLPLSAPPLLQNRDPVLQRLFPLWVSDSSNSVSELASPQEVWQTPLQFQLTMIGDKTLQKGDLPASA